MPCTKCKQDPTRNYLIWVENVGEVIIEVCDECFADYKQRRGIVDEQPKVKAPIDPTKKRRGRPPGSKNKKTIEREITRKALLR